MFSVFLSSLSTVYENTFESLRELEKIAHQLIFPGHFSFSQTSTHVSTIWQKNQPWAFYSIFLCPTVNKAVQVLHGSHFARQKQQIIFPMGKNVVSDAKHFHCSYHATWATQLPRKTSAREKQQKTVKIVKILTHCYSTRKTITLSSFTFLLVNSTVRYSGVIWDTTV